MSDRNCRSEDALDVGKIVGYWDAMIEQVLREDLMNPQEKQRWLRTRATLMANFRAFHSREPGVQEEAKQYFAELHRIMNRPPPSGDYLEGLFP
jgi:hypothetical protein